MTLPVYDYAKTLVGEVDLSEVTLAEEEYIWTTEPGLKLWRACGKLRGKKCFLYWMQTPEISAESPHHILLDMREDWD